LSASRLEPPRELERGPSRGVSQDAANAAKRHAVLGQALAEGYAISLPAAGGSMRPLLRSGDLLQVAPLGGIPLRPGDIAVVSRGDSFLAHRVAEIDPAHGLVRMKGDDCEVEDAPVRADAVLGRVVGFRRGSVELRLDAPLGRALDTASRFYGPLRARARRLIRR
jgi:hypothetical protein